MRPSILAVFLLALIRSLESFEVPLLIGAPGNLHTLTTAIYQSIHTGFLPKYGEASAFAVLLLADRGRAARLLLPRSPSRSIASRPSPARAFGRGGCSSALGAGRSGSGF